MLGVGLINSNNRAGMKIHSAIICSASNLKCHLDGKGNFESEMMVSYE